MQTTRHMGIELHRNRFTCCVRLENGREYLREWKLEDLERFTQKLRPADQIAVEVTGNTRLFRDAVKPHVKRVVAVDPNQFQVDQPFGEENRFQRCAEPGAISGQRSAAGGEMKDKTQAQVASLTQTRDTLVKLRTALKNKINNILSAHGVNLAKEALSSEKALNEVLAMQFDPMVEIELRVIIDQIRSLK